MPSPVTRLARLVSPRASREVVPCLVCSRAVRQDHDRMRLRGGGYVHLECATYRMRRHDGRPAPRGSRQA